MAVCQKEPVSNRERLERDEEARVDQARKSPIPGMVTHQWNAAFYSDAMRDAVSRRKIR